MLSKAWAPVGEGALGASPHTLNEPCLYSEQTNDGLSAWKAVPQHLMFLGAEKASWTRIAI